MTVYLTGKHQRIYVFYFSPVDRVRNLFCLFVISLSHQTFHLVQLQFIFIFIQNMSPQNLLFNQKIPYGESTPDYCFQCNITGAFCQKYLRPNPTKFPAFSRGLHLSRRYYRDGMRFVHPALINGRQMDACAGTASIFLVAITKKDESLIRLSPFHPQMSLFLHLFLYNSSHSFLCQYLPA